MMLTTAVTRLVAPAMFSTLLAATLSSVLLILPGSAPAVAQEEKVLNVFNWSDYIAEDTIANFEKETGIKVNYDVYDSNEVLDAKLLTGRSGFDIVVPSNHYLTKQIEAGVYQRLDHSKLPNMKNLNPDLMDDLASIDPGRQYSIPYMWGSTGICYIFGRVKSVFGDHSPLYSWDLMFKPEIAAK